MAAVKVINIRQPWAWLVVQGYKDVENRRQNTNYRGEVFVLATKTVYQDEIDRLRAVARQENIKPPTDEELKRGGIVGRFYLTDVISSPRFEDDFWFTGPLGYVVTNPEPLAFLPLKGLQNGRVYTHQVPDSYLAAIATSAQPT